jgi:mannan endo-1,4-beta-mannosidase
MPIKKYYPVIILLFISFKAIAQTYSPVNPDASDGVKRTLNFLYEIKGRYTLSGQQNYNSDLNTFRTVPKQ